MKNQLVIKIGTQAIIKNNTVDYSVIRRLGLQILELRRKKNLQVILVVSGSIGLGMNVLGCEERPKEKIILQRCAGVGQIELMNVYTFEFRKLGLITSQYLITYHNLESPEEVENIRKNIADDISQGIVPLVNYNDKVDWQEITRDNDELSAIIALLSGASKLLILTIVDGFMEKGSVIPEIRINEIEARKKLCEGTNSYGTGGFETKLEAAKITVSKGIDCIIGNIKYPIENLLDGKVPRTVICR